MAGWIDPRLDRQTAFSKSHFCTQELLHTEASTHGSLYTGKPLGRAASTHRSVYTETPLHKQAFTRDSFCKGAFCTERPFHRAAFTHRSEAFTQSSLLRLCCAYVEPYGTGYLIGEPDSPKPYVRLQKDPASERVHARFTSNRSNAASGSSTQCPVTKCHVCHTKQPRHSAPSRGVRTPRQFTEGHQAPRLPRNSRGCGPSAAPTPAASHAQLWRPSQRPQTRSLSCITHTYTHKEHKGGRPRRV